MPSLAILILAVFVLSESQRRMIAILRRLPSSSVTTVVVLVITDELGFPRVLKSPEI